MKSHIGIDLGTTNSAICTYDGSDTRIWKSPEQNDVTPSAIYIDRRGSRFVGQRAYDAASRSPDNAATLFKRYMGTGTPVVFKALDLTRTPEECSSEVLKTLFGYLPEEYRAAAAGTVITVPAAFNQMQKDATLQAATMAGIGEVALMQEPVAAVMSVMRTRKKNGKFLVYDIGGGTFDIALAESTGGRVSLLAHGGIAMCGGRDIDRMLWNNVVEPWLRDTFTLPGLLSADPQYRTLHHLGLWAVEKAKIELSAREESIVNLPETEVRTKDLKGEEIYIHLPLSREVLDRLMRETIEETIHETRSLLSKTGVSPADIDSVVFIGGPTNYKPLRDKISFELGISANIDVNPMTAVAEGASLFAESVDWSTRTHSRKNTRGQVASGGRLPVTFAYTSRTPEQQAKIGVRIDSRQGEGYEFQIDSVDTAWTSGRMPLRHGVVVEVFLSRQGENLFRSSVFDPNGMPVRLENDTISIVRTAAAVDSIPASHSVAIEVLERLGGMPSLDFLVRVGDSLPAKGKRIYKAAETLKAGDANSLNFKLWEGDIVDRIGDNRPIGLLKISGSDLDGGVVPAGADLAFEYEILDSGNILVGVSIPCIGATFDSAGKNFYSRQEGEVDYLSDSVAEKIVGDGRRTMEQIDEMASMVSDQRLEHARRKLETVASLGSGENDPEKRKEADERLLEARKILSEVRKENLSEFREKQLDLMASEFEENVRKFAKPSEVTDFHNLLKTARRAMDRKDSTFDELLSQIHLQVFHILWRQDFFVIGFYKTLISEQQQFGDASQFSELALEGLLCIQNDNMDGLRQVVGRLLQLRAGGFTESMFDLANIIRG